MSLYNRLLSQYNRLMSLYNRLTETGRQNQQKKNFFLRGNFRQFSNKNVYIWDHFFPLLFPKDSESLNILDIRHQEVGAKRPLNGTSKVNTQTDRQTDGQTHRRTNRLIESIGPEGRCFKNKEHNKGKENEGIYPQWALGRWSEKIVWMREYKKSKEV